MVFAEIFRSVFKQLANFDEKNVLNNYQGNPAVLSRFQKSKTLITDYKLKQKSVNHHKESTRTKIANN